MASNILPAAQQYLNDNDSVNQCYIVSIELPGASGAYTNVTDYKRDIMFDGSRYESGRLKRVSGISRTAELSASPVTITITGALQAEVDRAMNSASYLERVIKVWRVVIKSDGSLLEFHSGVDALLLFEGSISEVSIKENSTVSAATGTSEISWKCSSAFYELDRVNGRITDDDSHRGIVIDSNGNEVPSSAAKKPEYQDDLGFFHSNQSIDVLATYQTEEKRTRLKKKKSWGGLKVDYDMVEYYETVTKEVDIRFNLSAKYLPVVYGVQQVQGIPIFADTLADDPTKVYVVYAFCEGEIEGFLDFYLDEKPIICFNNEDSQDRVCFGSRYVFGDTIGSVAVLGGEGPNACTLHGTEYIYDDGNGKISLWPYHGTNTQASSALLTGLAASDKFYLQDGQGSAYWSDKFKLTDTAYVVMEVDVTENRSDIPTLHADVRGRKVNVYNAQHEATTNETSLNAAWQILDYLRSPIYGVGITLDRIDLDSFYEVAAIFDTEDTSYESGWAPHWRYLGWTESDNNQRQIMQTNTRLDTNNTLFKNMDTMLKQVLCSLNIVNGKYTLTVESASKPPIVIPEHHILGGSLSVSDVTSKNKFNTVTATIEDPGLGWKTNNVVFFDGEYLEEDQNVEKKLTLAFPNITNYYTARALAERELRKSRFNREVEVTLPFKYVDLPINSPVHLSKARFGWDNKEFLLRNATLIGDGKTRVTLREYSEGVFINSPKVDKSSNKVPSIINLIKPPRQLEYVPTPQAVDGAVGQNGIIRWLPSLSPDVTYYTVRVSGDLDPIVVPVDSIDPALTHISTGLFGYSKGNYTIECRAVSTSRGLSSAPATIVVDLDPAKNLPKVTGFQLSNPALGDTFTWIGPAPIFVWDSLAEGYLEAGTESYTIEILDAATDTILSVYNTNGLTVSYPFSDNKVDYAGNGYGVGIFRNIKARIVAVGDDGERSVAWTTL